MDAGRQIGLISTRFVDLTWCIDCSCSFGFPLDFWIFKIQAFHLIYIGVGLGRLTYEDRRISSPVPISYGQMSCSWGNGETECCKISYRQNDVQGQLGTQMAWLQSMEVSTVYCNVWYQSDHIYDCILSCNFIFIRIFQKSWPSRSSLYIRLFI